MREIYLDNSATTVVCEKGMSKAINMMGKNYGNPSSLHTKGLLAQNEVEHARRVIAKELGADESEIYFTSGGTEANNMAVFGSAFKNHRRGKKIVTTNIEHSSVYESMQELLKMGFEVVYLKPDLYGNISKEQIINAIDDKTILVSMMMVNNEVGSILPVQEVRKILDLKKAPAYFHVDAVQAFGKIPVKVPKLKADLISISAHKIHGPKGVGALYKNRKKLIIPRTFGGEQQDKIRPGTESSPLIAAFGAAVEEFNLEKNYQYVLELRNHLIKKLSKIEEITINSGKDALPYIINFSTNGIKAETMLHFLASEGIYVSGGSACAKGKKSRVLKHLGFSDKRVTSSIRVSFSKLNTIEEIDIFVEKLKLGLESLARE